MRPRLLIAAYHPASGTERAYSGAELAEMAAGAAGARGVGGAKVSVEASELLISAAVAEGITSIATVHDSFGCLAAQAERFRRIIREQFVALYKEHDVMQEVLDEARRDLKDPKGPPGRAARAGFAGH